MTMTTTPPPVGRSARPALRPALRVLRRDRLTIQVGTDPERAVAYAVRDPAVVDLVCALDGRRTVPELARRHHLAPALVEQLVAELTEAGVLEDRTVGVDPVPAGVTPMCAAGHPDCAGRHPVSGGRARSRQREAADGRRRLAPDLAAWDLLAPHGDGGRAEWDRRSHSTVEVVGSGRLGLSIALLLGAAGIGAIRGGDGAPARQSDRGALALAGVDVGRSRHEGLRRRLAEIAPGSLLTAAPGPDRQRDEGPRVDGRAGAPAGGPAAAGTLPAPGLPLLGAPGAPGAPGTPGPPATGPPRAGGSPGPDLVVLAAECAPERELAEQLSQQGIPHLLVTVSETLAVLGPFVEPGRSACVRCLDLHRADADPTWPLVLDRLGRGPTPGVVSRDHRSRAGVRPARGRPDTGVEASDDVLSTLVAAHAVLEITTFLRGQRPSSSDATVEFRLPSGMPRRRTWAAHPDCGCAWVRAAAGAAAARPGPAAPPDATPVVREHLARG